jgi:serine/threonine-protein kinase
VGDYVVERVLAQNARGRVYVAAGPSGERVVLKELVFRTVPGASQVDGFEREAEVLAQLDHPRIPRFIGTIHDGEGVHLRLYLVQQFIEGRTLLAELAEGPLREKELRQVAEQCLEVLVYLQGLHLLHRDIKPANLLRDAAGELWLVDFGTARALNHDETHRATLVGTFGYAPPEQLGGTVDVTSDLYGLGATLIHLASGVAPDTMIDPGLNLNFERAVRVSWRFRVFLRKLVSRNRADRPQSPDEAMELLHARGPALWPRFRAVSWSQHVIPTPLAVALFVVPIPLAIVVANLVMQQRDNTRREVALRAAAPAPAARPTPANPPKSVPAEPQPLKVGTSNDIASDAGASTR